MDWKIGGGGIVMVTGVVFSEKEVGVHGGRFQDVSPSLAGRGTAFH